MKHLLIAAVSFCFIACQPLAVKEKEKEPKLPPPSIVGRWTCTSVDYTIDNHKGSVIIGSEEGPFKGINDRIEYLEFSADSLIIKNGNDSLPMPALKYFYLTRENSNSVLLITDGKRTDTLFDHLGFTVYNMYFGYTETDTTRSGITTKDFNYDAKR